MLYVIKHNGMYFQGSKNYSYMEGYLDKKHPKRTNQYTIYMNEAMRFDTVYDAIAVKDAYNVIGGIVSIGGTNTSNGSKTTHKDDDWYEIASYLKSVVQSLNSYQAELVIAKKLDMRGTTLSKFIRDPYSIDFKTRQKILRNIDRIREEEK